MADMLRAFGKSTLSTMKVARKVALRPRKPGNVCPHIYKDKIYGTKMLGKGAKTLEIEDL